MSRNQPVLPRKIMRSCCEHSPARGSLGTRWIVAAHWRPFKRGAGLAVSCACSVRVSASRGGQLWVFRPVEAVLAPWASGSAVGGHSDRRSRVRRTHPKAGQEAPGKNLLSRLRVLRPQAPAETRAWRRGCGCIESINNGAILSNRCLPKITSSRARVFLRHLRIEC